MEVVSGLVSVAEPTHVAEARRCAAVISNALGFDAVTSGRVAIVVTEAATNLLKHGDGGDLFVGRTGAGEPCGVQVLAMDKGAGIASLTASLRDGVSTAGTPGTGLGAIGRVASSFDIYTSREGTVVAATVYPGSAPPEPMGGVSVAFPGERECGDAWAAWSAGELTSMFLVDGLGHGSEAAAAARQAVETFRQHAERSASEVLACVHERLRGTRGAAVALAELDRRNGTLRYCGLGNIGGVIALPDGREQHLVSLSGIAGHVMRRLQPFTYPWPPGSLLIMHSDGIGSHWAVHRYPELSSRRADVVAGVLFRDHRRGRDDATIVVLRNEPAQ